MRALRLHPGNKFGNRKTPYGGRMFASKKEADYARRLDLLQLAGEVSWWSPQVKVPLKCNGKRVC